MKIWIIKETNNLSDREEGTVAVCTSLTKAYEIMKEIAKDPPFNVFSVELNERENIEFTTVDMYRKDGAFMSFEIVPALTDELL